MRYSTLPEWVKKEEKKLVIQWLFSFEKFKMDLFEYADKHASKELLEFHEKCRKRREEKLKDGIIED